MIGTSFPEWIFIRLSILFLRYTPLIYSLALLALLLTYYQEALNLVSAQVLGALLLAEALYYVAIYRPFQARLRNAAEHPPPLNRQERRALFDRCLGNVPAPELYLQWWFLGADRDEIRRENVHEFFLWGFFERGQEPSEDDDDEVEQEIDEYVSILEQRLGRAFEPGRGNAKCLRLTFDDIHTTYRSLAWYMIVFGIDLATHLAFLLLGFQYFSRSRGAAMRIFPPRPQELVSHRQSPAPELSYWYRPHSAPDQVPVVFFHGIGIGLWTYVRFLAGIHKANRVGQGKIGVIALEILPISFRLYAPIPSKPEFLEQMTAILNHHRWENVTVVSHSYGSVLTTHMLHSPQMQHRIQSVVLIDPVTILLHLPHVAYNFTRRHPKRANEWQLWYFASTDPGVALCLGRHFFWRENIIWKDELLCMRRDGRRANRKVVVCLSGRDLIVDTAAVAEYLEGSPRDSPADFVEEQSDDKVQVVHFPKLDHAQVFDHPPECERVIQMIKSSCNT